VEGPLNNLKQSMVQFQKPRKYYHEMYRRYHLPPSLLEQTLNPGGPGIGGPLPPFARDFQFFSSPDGIFNPPLPTLTPKARPTSSRRMRDDGQIRDRYSATRRNLEASQSSIPPYSQRPLTQQSLSTSIPYERYHTLSQDSAFGDHLTFESSQTGASQLHLGTQDSLAEMHYPQTQGDLMIGGMQYNTQQTF